MHKNLKVLLIAIIGILSGCGVNPSLSELPAVPDGYGVLLISVKAPFSGIFTIAGEEFSQNGKGMIVDTSERSYAILLKTGHYKIHAVTKGITTYIVNDDAIKFEIKPNEITYTGNYIFGEPTNKLISFQRLDNINSAMEGVKVDQREKIRGLTINKSLPN